jgi:hypothetical protein
MTFSDAAAQAQKAAASASAAKSHYTDYEDRKLAEAVHQLAKAVQEMADALHREF